MEGNVERMKAGKLYSYHDEVIMAEQSGYWDKMHQFNQSSPSETEKRITLLHEMLGEVGEGCWIEAPFYCNWGGKHVFLGKHVYANFHLTIVDDGIVRIGDFVQIGPNVTITTAGHPIDSELRKHGLQFNADISIGENVWIGAGATILPGVTIGKNTVIGAGSVVTKDIPEKVVAAGNPCRVLRKIGERDKKYYFRDKIIDI